MQSPSCQLSGELLECWLGTSVFELNKIIQKYENRNVLFLCFSLSLYWKGMVIFLWEALSQFFTIFQASTKFCFFFLMWIICLNPRKNLMRDIFFLYSFKK